MGRPFRSHSSRSGAGKQRTPGILGAQIVVFEDDIAVWMERRIEEALRV